MLVYIHSTHIYIYICTYMYMYKLIRRKQLPATAWYAVMSYGAESACSRDLLRSITTFIVYDLTYEEAYL